MEDFILKLEFYVPPSHLESVKEALFAAGAGRLGNYDMCAWQTLGAGQYRPGLGSEPFVGYENQVETIEEYKVEMVCKKSCIDEVLMALKNSHPYEEPAYSVIKLESWSR